jgi:hypothetical protein
MIYSFEFYENMTAISQSGTKAVNTEVLKYYHIGRLGIGRGGQEQHFYKNTALLHDYTTHFDLCDVSSSLFRGAVKIFAK